MRRRQFLTNFSALGIAAAGWPNFLSHAFAESTQDTDNILIVVNLTGGADPLTLFPPVGDDHYFKSRPNLSYKSSETIKLSDLFSLNKSMENLFPIWMQNEMRIVHQVGLGQIEQSHAIAQGKLGAGDCDTEDIGFLNRALVARGLTHSPLSAIASDVYTPPFFSGVAKTLALSNLEKYCNNKNAIDLNEMLLMGTQDADFVNAIRTIQKKIPANEVKSRPQQVATSPLVDSLDDISKLIEANIGLKYAYASSYNWDTHFSQKERLERSQLMEDLSNGISLLRNNLIKKNLWHKCLVLIVTEFGRCVAENGSLGSDHGYGSAAILIGESFKDKPQKIIHDWKELKEENLYQGRYLQSHYNFRDLFAEVLDHHCKFKEDEIKKILPGGSFSKVGIFS